MFEIKTHRMVEPQIQLSTWIFFVLCVNTIFKFFSNIILDYVLGEHKRWFSNQSFKFIITIDWAVLFSQLVPFCLV